MVEYAYIIPVLWRLRQEDQEFKVILSYLLSSRPAYTEWDPAKKNKNKRKKVLVFFGHIIQPGS